MTDGQTTTTATTTTGYRYSGPTIADALRGWEGIPELARELRISVTAPERHRARMLGTIRAAAEYVWSDAEAQRLARLVERGAHGYDAHPQDAAEWAETERERRLVAALIQLDLHGIGGHGGYSGGATDRMVWATQAGLGKARWQASDGGAWRGAAEAAVVTLGFDPDATLAPPTLAELFDYVSPEDDVWIVAYATHQMHRLVDSCGDASGGIQLSGLDLSVRDGLWLWDSLRVAAITDSPRDEEARAQAASIGLARDQVARLHLLAPWCRVADEAGERLRAGELEVEHAAGDHETSVVLRLGEEQWVVDRWEAAERLFGVAAAAAWS